MRIIGSANEFWRLRLTRVDTTEDFDFEWHDDILYREPRITPADELEMWHVEAVELENHDAVVRLATFNERDEAEAFYDRAHDDLGEMTKHQFEEAYVSQGRLAEDG